MPFLFTCPHCGSRTQIPETYVGESGPCHACGKTVRIEPPDNPNQQELPASSASVGVLIASVLGVVCLLIAGGGIFLVLVLPKLQVTSASRKQTLSKANIEQIVSAMHAYHAQHNVFPPAYLTDKNGNRLHSWRVLLLPHLGPEAANIYSQLKLDEPWDSPHNLTIAGFMPDVYRSAADPAAQASNVASFYVIVGKQTIFPEDGKSLAIRDCTGPLNHTIMIVESVGRSTIWTKPDDYEISRMSFELNTFDKDDLSGPHPGGVMVGLADGTAYFLEDETPLEMVEGMTTRNGDDVVPPEL